MNIFVLLAVAAVGGLLGFLAAALFYAYHARRRKSRKGARRWKVEFIKLVLMLVMATYFLGVAVGVKIVLEYPEHRSAHGHGDYILCVEGKGGKCN